MKIYLPVGSTPSTYYKYGPTPDNPLNHWYEFLYDNETGAEINENIITLHFIDGKRGDDILTQDGKISDTGGPGFPDEGGSNVSSDSDDDRGLCFLDCLIH